MLSYISAFHSLLEANAATNNLTGSCQALGVTTSGFQRAMRTQHQQDGKIGVPSKRGSAALHLRNLLAALPYCIAKFSLRHVHLLSVRR